jgi:hypothetical protein
VVIVKIVKKITGRVMIETRDVEYRERFTDRVIVVHYRFLDPAVKANITRLEKGELVLSHAIFRQPVKIVFPKPAYLQEGV